MAKGRNKNGGLMIKVALAKHNHIYSKKTLKQLGEKLYPKLEYPEGKVSGLISGKVKVSRAEVVMICKELKCSANLLFGV